MDNANNKDMICLPRAEYDRLIATQTQMDLILAVSDKDNYSAGTIIEAVKASRCKAPAEAVATAPAGESDEE